MPRRLRTKEETRILNAEILERFLLTDASMAQIGKDLRVDPAQVRQVLQRHHVPLLRKGDRRRRPVSPAQNAAAWKALRDAH